MSDSVLITLIATGGFVVAVIGWKLLDIGKRAVELDRGSDDRRVFDDDRRRDGRRTDRGPA